MTEDTKTGLGIVGCGAFGLFALQQFIQNPRAKVVAIGGTTRQEAKRVADRHGIAHTTSADEVFSNDEVDLIYINTPPSLHAEQCKKALNAGKHVIVEKPLAISVTDGEQLTDQAKNQQRVLVANLMQRYNPVAERVREILDTKTLGECLYASLENHAVDEGLGTDHWFWDPAISGGIFIEHGVHFFDLARWWFGELEVVSAGQNRTRADNHVDQVWCDTKAENGLICRFYHGFNQTSRLEKQVWRIVCERGTIEMQGWIPMGIEVQAIVDDSTTKSLTDLLPDYRLNVLENYGATARRTRAHGQWFDVDQKVHVTWSQQMEKQPLYCQLLRDMLDDQLQFIADARHKRTITEANGLESLRLAVAATELAHTK